MNLRAYLGQRERELLEQIAKVHAQLVPLEAELAEVRRAKASIGLAFPATLESALDNRTKATERLTSALSPENIARAYGRAQTSRDDAIKMMTMKELVIKALFEHFYLGATTRELLDFFRDAWGRKLERSNLSPQISRLAQDGIIERVEGGHWCLTPKGYTETELEMMGHWPQAVSSKAAEDHSDERALMNPRTVNLDLPTSNAEIAMQIAKELDTLPGILSAGVIGGDPQTLTISFDDNVPGLEFRIPMEVDRLLALRNLGPFASHS
jgi:hypothetical protein